MAKDFSSVTPRPAAAAGPASAPHPASREPVAGRRRVVAYGVGGALVVALLALVVALFVRSGGEDAGAAPAAPHGPTAFVDGVPSGYTRDKGGAATAAVNFLQADDKAMAGLLDIAAVENALVSQNPSPKLTEVIDSARGREEKGDTFTTLPATVTVRTLSADEADVSVWALGSGSLVANAAGDKSTVATWGTADLHLVWEDGDWKVADYAFRVGPQPGQQSASATDPAQVESGYYSFFVN